MRKSLWSPDEDDKLKNYVTQFGYGNWSDVAKHAGLQRCGKSCRLRWLNYLRPDLKRGKFSPDEIRLIVKLHRTLGNSWSKIASCLPGRTDNDIKNFWHSYTRSTKRVILPASTVASADSLRPLSDFGNNKIAATQSHLPDCFHTSVITHAPQPTPSSHWHHQQLDRTEHVALQHACTYNRPCPTCRDGADGLAANHHSIYGAVNTTTLHSLRRFEDDQQQHARRAPSHCSPTASGSSPVPSPSALSFQDSASIARAARDAAPLTIPLPPHSDPSIHLVSRRSTDDPVMDAGCGSCTMADIQRRQFHGGSIYINSAVPHHHQQAPQDDHDDLLSTSAWDPGESADDGLHSVLLNFMNHQLLPSKDDFT